MKGSPSSGSSVGMTHVQVLSLAGQTPFPYNMHTSVFRELRTHMWTRVFAYQCVCVRGCEHTQDSSKWQVSARPLLTGSDSPGAGHSPALLQAGAGTLSVPRGTGLTTLVASGSPPLLPPHLFPSSDAAFHRARSSQPNLGLALVSKKPPEPLLGECELGAHLAQGQGIQALS